MVDSADSHARWTPAGGSCLVPARKPGRIHHLRWWSAVCPVMREGQRPTISW